MLQLVFVTVLSVIIYSNIIQLITKLILIFTVNQFHSSVIIILLFININIMYVRWHNKMSEYYSIWHWPEEERSVIHSANDADPQNYTLLIQVIHSTWLLFFHFLKHRKYLLASQTVKLLLWSIIMLYNVSVMTDEQNCGTSWHSK
jgi:hypothetical protein